MLWPRYALTGKEVQSILMQRLIKVDGKVRTDHTYPIGFMDVISIDKTDEYFRLVYDTKGRFMVHRISKEEAAYKLCKVRGPAGLPGGTAVSGSGADACSATDGVASAALLLHRLARPYALCRQTTLHRGQLGKEHPRSSPNRVGEQSVGGSSGRELRRQ